MDFSQISSPPNQVRAEGISECTTERQLILRTEQVNWSTFLRAFSNRQDIKSSGRVIWCCEAMAYIQEYIHGKKLYEFISTNLIFLHFDINLAISHAFGVIYIKFL